MATLNVTVPGGTWSVMLHVDAQSAVCRAVPYDTLIDFVPAETYRTRRPAALAVDADGTVIKSATCSSPAAPLAALEMPGAGGSVEPPPPPPPPQAPSKLAQIKQKESWSARKRGLIG